MSHFTAHVFIPADQAGNQDDILEYLEKVLQPYDENEDGERRPDKTYDRAEIEELRKSEYANKICDIPDDREFLSKWTGKDLGDIVWNEKDDTFTTYTYYNANSKWDWWVIGGRWSNFFGDTDQIKVSELNWANDQSEREIEANFIYDEYEKATAGLEMENSWSGLVALVESGDLTIEAARELYHSQPWYEAARSAMGKYMMEDPETYFMVNEGGREAFVQRERNKVGVPFAYINLEGEWKEKGEMGWFGMAHNESAQVDWATEYFNYLTSVQKDQPDAVIVNIDCHI